MSRRLAVATVLLVGAVATGCGGAEASAPPAPAASAPQDERLVLVSGRDDHGMVALEQVPAYDAPGGDHAVGEVADGTLARVVGTDGQWLEVATVEGPSVSGWIDDFYLRGEARLVGPPPSCAVRVGGDRRTGGTLVVVRALRGALVRVDTVTEPRVTAWARRADLQELPPQGARCGDVPPDDRHAEEHAH